MVLDIIVSIFFPLLFASKMGKLGKTGKVILKFVNIMNGIIEKAIGIALKPVAFTAKYIFKAIDKIFTAIAKGAKFINKIIDEIALQLEKIILKSFANIKIEFYIFVKGKVRRLNGTFLPIEGIFKIIGKQISKKIENKFNNLSIIFVEDAEEGVFHIIDAETKATLKTGNKKQIKKWIEEVDKKDTKDAKKFVDELKEITEKRRFFLKKWAKKFEKKFHLHFDGEFIIKVEKGIKKLKGAGGHNYLLKDKNIKIRKYLTEPIDDMPFDTLISVRYKNGQWIDKAAKSSMFPKNWDITRVKEEIALVYEEMIKSGKQFHPKSTNRYYIYMNSEKTFKIKIEFDELGNFTNAYPWLKN